MRKIDIAYLKKDLDYLIKTLESVHPNLYAFRSKVDIEKNMNKIASELIDSLTKEEFYIKVAPLISSLNDGHTVVYFPGEEYDKYIDNSGVLFPLEVIFEERRAFVYRNHSNGAISKGAEIFSINGYPIVYLIEKFLKYLSGEKENMKLELLRSYFRALFWMIYQSEDRFEIEFANPGTNNRTNIEIDGVTYEEIQKAINNEDYTPFTFKIELEKNIGIMEINSFSDLDVFKPFVEKAFKELKNKDTKVLIIDLRKNWGGDSRIGDELLAYIADKPYRQFGAVKIKVSKEVKEYYEKNEFIKDYYMTSFPEVLDIIPSKKIGETIKVEYKFLEPKQELHFDGEVFVLIGPNTYSSALSFVTTIKDYDFAVLVGEEAGGTACNFGDVYSFKLPYSELVVGVSHKEHIRPSGKRIFEVIAPDIEIEETALEKIHAKDKVIEHIKERSAKEVII